MKEVDMSTMMEEVKKRWEDLKKELNEYGDDALTQRAEEVGNLILQTVNPGEAALLLFGMGHALPILFKTFLKHITESPTIDVDFMQEIVSFVARLNAFAECRFMAKHKDCAEKYEEAKAAIERAAREMDNGKRSKG